MQMTGISAVSVFSFLSKPLASLNRSSVYAYWRYAFILRYLQLCWHPGFCVFNIYKLQPDRKFGNVWALFLSSLKSKIYVQVFVKKDKGLFSHPLLVKNWVTFQMKAFLR